jgi:hypothetical protein
VEEVVDGRTLRHFDYVHSLRLLGAVLRLLLSIAIFERMDSLLISVNRSKIIERNYFFHAIHLVS